MLAEESTQFSSASSHGRRIHWLLSSASLGNIDEDTELSITDLRLESSASGATLEVKAVAALTSDNFMKNSGQKVLFVVMDPFLTIDLAAQYAVYIVIA